MSSDSEVEQSSGDNLSSKQEQFVSLLKGYKVIFNKSQLPVIKTKKHAAFVQIADQFNKLCNITLTPQQVNKKINNMKTELKKKTDQRATGNKKIILKKWEQELLTLMEGDSNPVITHVPGAIAAGTSIQSTSQAALPTKVSSPPPSPPPLKKRLKLTGETEETVKLTTSELQRLVLLEQLQLIRMQKEEIGRREENRKNLDNSENTYSNLSDYRNYYNM